MLIKQEKRIRRHKKVRAKVAGTAKVPRLCVFRSGAHIYAQLINDEQGKTIAQASDLKENSKSRNLEMSVVVGRELTKKFETIYRGTIEQVIERIKKDAPNGKPMGEFVVALNSCKENKK